MDVRHPHEEVVDTTVVCRDGQDLSVRSKLHLLHSPVLGDYRGGIETSAKLKFVVGSERSSGMGRRSRTAIDLRAHGDAF